jgi:hypothetical protein
MGDSVPTGAAFLREPLAGRVEPATGTHRRRTSASVHEVLEHVSTAPHAAFAPGFGGSGRGMLFLCTTFGYGKGNPRIQHEAAMLRMEVATPGGGLP